MTIHLINGPNLNLLGRRQPDIYGDQSFEEYLKILRSDFKAHDIMYFQSNHEGDIIDYLHDIGFNDCGIILNPAGLTHTSVSLADAVAAIDAPVVEVHISNIHSREDFRKINFVGSCCVGNFIGLGLDGYRLAIEHLIDP